MLRTLKRVSLQSHFCRSTSLTFRYSPHLQLRTFLAVPSHDELGYALITPKSIAKSHTGGIVARLLATPGLNLVGARMYQPSDRLVERLVDIMRVAAAEDNVIEPYEEALINFASSLTLTNCRAKGFANRTLLLLFSGPKVLSTLKNVIGDNLPPPTEYGKTIRGTYGDYTQLDDQSIVTFEPSVLTAHTITSNRKSLEAFAAFAESDGGFMVPFRPDPTLETGLVMIKPDNFLRPSALPGHIIDLFGTTGLHLVGAKVFSMSISQAQEFYGFLEDVFVNKLSGQVLQTLQTRLDGAFSFPLTEQDYRSFTDLLKTRHAQAEVHKIMEYMTGIHPSKASTPEDQKRPGPAKCLGLLFRGHHAIEIIRNKLGSTDPKKAAAGTIRSDYGTDLMRNGAHASDSVASADRERRIVGLQGIEVSDEKLTINSWLQATAGQPVDYEPVK